MTVEIERLVARYEADTRGINRKLDDLADKLKDTSDDVQDRASRMGTAIATAIGAAIGAISLQSIMDVNLEFERLEARLRALAKGDAALARRAFEELSEVASTLPFSLEQTADAFIKMLSRGLNPSERALRSFADTAAVLADERGIEQVVEAVADAVTFQFDRLTELGIIARKEGNRVRLTFRGVTRTVQADARSITEALVQLGETEFAGAAEEQMKGLGGSLERLRGAFRKAARQIGEEGGFNDFMKVAADIISTRLGPAVNALIFTVRRFGDIVGGVAAAVAADLSGNMERARMIMEDVYSGDRLRAIEDHARSTRTAAERAAEQHQSLDEVARAMSEVNEETKEAVELEKQKLALQASQIRGETFVAGGVNRSVSRARTTAGAGPAGGKVEEKNSNKQLKVLESIDRRMSGMFIGVMG